MMLRSMMALCALSAMAAWAEQPFADRVLLNGRVLTVDAKDSIAEAIAIRGDRILAVGTTAEIEALAGPDTERIDLAGRSATPGLLDSHAHFSEGGLMRLTALDLSFPNAKNFADVSRLVAEWNAATEPDQWIVGRGWDEGKLEERRLIHAADIDPVTGNRPAWLAQTMGHYGVANSFALTLAGITATTPNPPGGVIDRAADGTPTGVLKESAMALVTRHIPPATGEQQREALRQMADAFNSEGMTGVKDPGIGNTDGDSLEPAQEAWQAYKDVLAEDELSVRVFALWPSPKTLEGAQDLIDLIAGFTHPDRSKGDDRLISGGVKLFADGSGGARTAWVWDDWNMNRTQTDAGNRGFPAIDAELLRQQIMLYHDAGLHMGVHAIGDRAIDWVVASYGLALMRKPQSGLRHSIIHSNIPTELAMDTMGELQRRYDAAYPESQANFTWWIGDTYAGNFGRERSLRLNPFRTFQQKGILWAGGSDFFVTPFPARYGLWATVAREPLLGVYGKDAFGHDESVDARTALRSFTMWAARQMFLEEKIGSLEAGKYADIAVWNTDFYTASPQAVKEAKCQMTLFNGEVVYVAEEP